MATIPVLHARRLPVELFGLVALHLLPPEPFACSTDDFLTPEYRTRSNTLRDLAYTCRQLYRALEPLLHRFVVLRNGRQIVSLFMLLADRPHKREHVRHLICNTAAYWESNLEGVREVWEDRYGRHVRLEHVFHDAGFQVLDHEMDRITYEEPEILDPTFRCDDSLNFAFGAVLVMLGQVETLSIHREVTKSGSMELVGLMLRFLGRRYQLFQKLRTLKITTEENNWEFGDVLKHFLQHITTYDVPQTLIVSGAQSDLINCLNFFTHFRGTTMPQLRTLRVRSWLTPPELRRAPVVPNVMNVRVLDSLPAFFRGLQELDVEFVRPPHTGHELWAGVDTWLRGSLEVLRLRCQRFPHEVLRGRSLGRLRLLAVELCVDVVSRPQSEDVLRILAAGMEGDEFKHRALRHVELNGSRFLLDMRIFGLPVVTQLE
ncbi:hypothetical protein B0I35DRAFT_236672 [Stachybotrys elegans]|uniref:Uncharacterized protein n=1 Tax=Stachybotrys elegans TaxID=80388 RepID=A0A8K0WS66_9HYPO|nr:hypothetical protein B0I35DRAFT_236672 [Stachybotrys elegans]